jgi:hypothetical protein
MKAMREYNVSLVGKLCIGGRSGVEALRFARQWAADHQDSPILLDLLSAGRLQLSVPGRPVPTERCEGGWFAVAFRADAQIPAESEAEARQLVTDAVARYRPLNHKGERLSLLASWTEKPGWALLEWSIFKGDASSAAQAAKWHTMGQEAHAMNPKERIRRIVESCGVAAATFWREKLQSLVEVWRYEDRIILTWEEAPDGAQYDESRYTKDERHVFDSVGQALAFLEQHAVAFSEFSGIIQRKSKNA